MATLVKIIAHGVNDDSTAPASLKFRVYNAATGTQIGSDLSVGGDVSVALNTPTSGSYQVTIDNFDVGSLVPGTDSIKISAVDESSAEGNKSAAELIVVMAAYYLTFTGAKTEKAQVDGIDLSAAEKIEIRTKINNTTLVSFERLISLGAVDGGTTSLVIGNTASGVSFGSPSGLETIALSSVENKELKFIAYNIKTGGLYFEIWADGTKLTTTVLGTIESSLSLGASSYITVSNKINATSANNYWDGDIYPIDIYIDDVLTYSYKMTEGSGSTIGDSVSGKDLTIISPDADAMWHAI